MAREKYLLHSALEEVPRVIISRLEEYHLCIKRKHEAAVNRLVMSRCEVPRLFWRGDYQPHQPTPRGSPVSSRDAPTQGVTPPLPLPPLFVLCFYVSRSIFSALFSSFTLFLLRRLLLTLSSWHVSGQLEAKIAFLMVISLPVREKVAKV